MTSGFHVTSSLNWQSILEHGLDWSRMGAARGIAGSQSAEQQGCFLVFSEWDCEWFVRMNNTGGTVDVWEVMDVDQYEFVESPEGYQYYPGVIPQDKVRLVRSDIAASQ